MIETTTALASRLDRLQILRATLTQQKSKLLDRRREIETELALKPEVEQLLQGLSEHMHQHALGRFESLLTALVQDIFGHQEKVKLTLRQLRGGMHLDLQMETPGGVEDILTGRGGSLANVISCGLRLIVLARSGLRPFLVLDEPDCWIKPDLAPAFFLELAQLAEEAGIQLLLISHHDRSLFDERIHCVEFFADQTPDGKRQIRVAPEPPEETGSVRAIELTNFMTHVHSRIPLAAGVTALVGDNDIGKSAVVTALRAAFYGEGNDACIRHGAESCQVKVVLEDKTIVWNRRAGRSKKTDYQLLDADGNVLKEHPAASVPDWMAELGFGLVDGLDVQVGCQKTPIFMLDQPGSRRAKLLAIGREAIWIERMIQRYKEELRDLKAEAKNLDRQLAGIQATLAALDGLDPVAAQVQLLQEQEQDLNHAIQKKTAMAQMAERLEKLRRLSRLPVPRLPDAGILDRMEEDLKRGRRLSRLHRTLVALAGCAAIRPPSALTLPFESWQTKIQCIGDLARRIERLRQMARLRDLKAPQFPDDSHLDQLAQKTRQVTEGEDHIERLAQTAAAILQKRKTIRKLQQQMQSAAQKIRKLLDQVGERCPLCGGPIHHHSKTPAKQVVDTQIKN